MSLPLCLTNDAFKKKLLKLKNNAQFFIENCLKIIIDGRLADFILNEPQKLVLAEIETQIAEGKPIRVVILKARREGISTLIEALIYHRITMRQHRTGMVIAHELDSSKAIFEMARRFYTHFRLQSLRPMIRSMGVRNAIFDNPNANDPKRGLDSQLVVETAMDVQAGRSMEISYLHVSELAFFRDPDTLMTGLLQCINDANPDTMIVMESTANGVGGYFYDIVQAALAEKNDYKLIFLPWFIDDRYKQVVDGPYKMSDEEAELSVKYLWRGKTYVLSEEQKYWRHKKIENKFKGDVNRFRQEFPGTISEAFVYTGRTRFQQQALDDIESNVRPAVFRGFLHMEMLAGGKRKHKEEENQRGYLTIYERPQHKCEYVIFADVAEGIEVKERDADYSSVDVLRCDTLEQVAHWHGRIGPELLDDEILKLAWYYNEAFVGVEKNNMGYGVVASLKDKYGRLYINMVHDRNGKEITREFGWRTTTKTKPLMINGLSDAINERSIRINNLSSIEECRRYSIHSDGTLGAPTGQHDDRVISLAGAVQMYLHSYSEPESREETADWDGDEDDFDDEDND